MFKSNLSQEKLDEMYDVLDMIVKDNAYEKITIEDFELFLKSIGVYEYKIKTI